MEEIILDRRMLIPYALHSLFISACGIFLYNVEVDIIFVLKIAFLGLDTNALLV